MPGVHAKLSASSAARWLACPPSVHLTEGMKEKTSEYAKEGTAAHSIAEQKLRKYLNKSRKKIICEDKDMDAYTDDYRDYVIERYNQAKSVDPKAELFIEERLDYSEWAPEGSGTGDAVIIADDTCHIIDFKYGEGVPVSAIGNPQCRLYALGAISTYNLVYNFDKVKVHIFQPRTNNISTEELTVDELLVWGETIVKPAAELAYRGEGAYNPGEKQCRWCLAQDTCKARAKKNLGVFINNEEGTALMSLEDIAQILPAIKEMKAWCKDIEDYALNQMLDGKQIRGYKLVESRANRVITDEDGLSIELHEKGYEDNQIKRLKPLTELEKLVGKKDFTIISAGYVDKPKGKPTIAPISDARAPYETISAAEAFKDVDTSA